MDRLKKGTSPARKIKLCWIILSVIAVSILSVAGMLLIPPIEEICAILYLFSFEAAIISVFYCVGRWMAKLEFRRKQR